MMTDIIPPAILVGIGATAFMDLIAFVQKNVLSQHTLDYAMVGRWIGHLPRGQLVHHPISASMPIPFERMIGWSAHYLIGILFALGFQMIVGPSWFTAPSLLPAILFGLLTVAAPFLVLQPGMGAGLAARRAPRPNIARLKSLVAHLSFGIGLWVAAICLSLLA